MKNAENLLLILLIVFLSSCKVKFPPPPIEKCIHNSDNSAECADLRKGKDAYTRTDLTNYICTSAKDEEAAYNYCADLRQKLITCENRTCY
jgi:hypothetical protein